MINKFKILLVFNLIINQKNFIVSIYVVTIMFY